jgi:SPP1 gp7 family putative phage head morphogenesis protein
LFKRRAFTIAGEQRMQILAYVRQAIMQAAAEGLTLKEIEQRANEAFRQYGVTQQVNYHAATVFRTNLESAYHDAQWSAMRQPGMSENIGLLEYVTENDARVRPTHRQMHGLRRPPDDPIWAIWWPPNGYNCRCRIRIIPGEEVLARNLNPSSSVPDVEPDPGFVSGPAEPLFSCPTNVPRTSRSCRSPTLHVLAVHHVPPVRPKKHAQKNPLPKTRSLSSIAGKPRHSIWGKNEKKREKMRIGQGKTPEKRQTLEKK